MSAMLQGYCRFILQTMLVISILFLLRGHNAPGGGFIAALIAVAAIGLYIITFGHIPKILETISSRAVIVGIIFLLISFLAPLIHHDNVLTGMWLNLSIANSHIKVGTPLLFDIGVYLCILGSITWFTIELEQAS